MMGGLNMPWCPNCKMEYQDGIETCADCGKELVENLYDPNSAAINYTQLVDIADEEAATRLVNFLEYSNVRNVTSEFYEETSTWKISVNSEDVKEAIKLYSAFKIAETSDEEKLEEIKKAKEQAYTNHTYVKKEEKYNDFKSSVTVFIPFGILGLIFVFLNVVKVLHFFNSPIQFAVLSICFIGFIYVGFTSMLKLKSIKEEIKEEQDNTSTITDWMISNITPEVLLEVTDESSSDEINYIHQTDKIKEMVLEHFGDMDENFVDQLVEDFYNEHIDIK